MQILSTSVVQASAVSRRREVALLLQCARTFVDSAAAEQIRALLREDIDWQYLIQAAHAQGVTPLLYLSLHTNCPEAIPKPVLTQLQRYFLSLIHI